MYMYMYVYLADCSESTRVILIFQPSVHWTCTCTCNEHVHNSFSCTYMYMYAGMILALYKMFSQSLSDSLKKFPDTLEDLKAILIVITAIRKMSLEVELRYKDIQEKYRTLAMYDIPVDEEESERAKCIDVVWADLFQEAKMVDRSLVSVKKKFTIITQDQVTTFQTEADELSTKFKTEGPGTVGANLDKGNTCTWHSITCTCIQYMLSILVTS